jgi:hypothetical protein
MIVNHPNSLKKEQNQLKLASKRKIFIKTIALAPSGRQNPSIVQSTALCASVPNLHKNLHSNALF